MNEEELKELEFQKYRNPKGKSIFQDIWDEVLKLRKIIEKQIKSILEKHGIIETEKFELTWDEKYES